MPDGLPPGQVSERADIMTHMSGQCPVARGGMVAGVPHTNVSMLAWNSLWGRNPAERWFC